MSLSIRVSSLITLVDCITQTEEPKLSIEKSPLPPRGDISRRDAGVDLTTPKNLKAFGLRLLIVEANTHKPSLLFFFIHQQSLLNKSSREKISGIIPLLRKFT